MSKPSAEKVRGWSRTGLLMGVLYAGVSYLIVSSACVARVLSG
jgi:hypothetical protein